MDPQSPSSEPPEKGRGPTGKIANSLVALGSAAVLTVYSAGYVRTRSAAARFAVEAADLRTAVPAERSTTAAPPQPSAAEGKLADATAAVPRVPAPRSVVGTLADRTLSAEPAPAPNADQNLAPASTEAPTALSSEAPAATPTPTTDQTPAASASATAEPPAAPTAPRFKDGTYLGWGYSRHGDIEASVVVQNGRVVSAEITQCLTRYSCSVIDTLPSQVLSRQNAFVDLISGATESATAFSNAIYRALVSSQK